ncbi:hypothetical protein BJX63DRAFT_435516 [Aspergillus granulosus]|uniref:Uncharacterized protein n=1 Tax=Aspergillus granulosus TaxID=176169 RepID=A0ABR4H0Q1_9EURO
MALATSDVTFQQVEVVSGMTLGEFILEKIRHPLSLRSTIMYPKLLHFSSTIAEVGLSNEDGTFSVDKEIPHLPTADKGFLHERASTKFSSRIYCRWCDTVDFGLNVAITAEDVLGRD